MTRLRFSLALAGAALLLFGADAGAAIQTQLKAAPGYNWGDFGVQGDWVLDYRQPNGAAGGAVIPFAVDVSDIDPDPNEISPEKIGKLDFQFVLWRGNARDDGTDNTVRRVGAAIMGGFHKTDVDDLNRQFSFLQIYTDNANPNGVVDGGGYRGKVNGDIAAWNQNPGHNYAGTEWDYFDNPYDPATRAETVSFETALVCYDATQVVILADFTWSFTSDGLGGVTGSAITAQNSASNKLMNLYGALLPNGGTLSNIGVASCHAVPEPTALLSAGVGFLGIGLVVRRRPARAA